MFCEGMSVARLRAPDGFQSYTWTRSERPTWSAATKQINVTDPNDGEIFTCVVKSELGCESELKTEIAKTQIDAAFSHGVKDETGNVDFPPRNWVSWYDTCTRTATFVERIKVYNSKKSDIEWTIYGTNVSSYDSMFTYTFPDPDTPTTYAVRLTAYAENGCVDTSQSPNRLITIYPSPRVKIDGPTQLCDGKIDYLIARTIRSKFVSHRWSGVKGDGTLVDHSGDTLEINGPGTYYLMSQDTNACYAYDTIRVTPLKPTLNDMRITHILCWGDTTGRFTYSSLSGGASPYQYAEWTVWNKSLERLDTLDVTASAAAGRTVWDQIAGKYAFYAVDAEGCDIRDTVHILQPDSLDPVSTTKKTTCLRSNGEIAFKVVGGVAPYVVSVRGSEISGEREPTNDTLKGLSAGIYIAKVVDKNQCVKEVEIELEAYPYPTLIADSIVIETCAQGNGEISLKAYYSITETDTVYAPEPTVYMWTPDTNSTGGNLRANRILFLKGGEYKLHFMDANGCIIDTTFFVDSFPSPKIPYVVRHETCGRKDGSITLTVVSASPDYITYKWAGLPNDGNMLTNLIAGSYPVEVTDSFCSVSDTIIVLHIDGPIANFITSTYSVPTNTVFTLTDATRGTPQAWKWNMGDGTDMTGRVIRHSYGTAGEYVVFMEVADTNNCIDTISKVMHIYDELHVYIPNMFTPNGDNLNDTWKPIILENSKEGYMLTVYDRWGQRVFHTTDPEASWDGMIDGKPAQNNTIYSYRLVVRDFTGQEFEFVGHVTVVR